MAESNYSFLILIIPLLLLQTIICLYIVICFQIFIFIGLVGRVFASGPGDLGSIPGRVILLKWYLIPPCLTISNIRYVSRVKLSHSGKGVVPSPTPRCSSY